MILPTVTIRNGNIVNGYATKEPQTSLLIPKNEELFQDKVYFKSTNSGSFLPQTNNNNNSSWQNQGLLTIPTGMPKAYSAVSLDSMT